MRTHGIDHLNIRVRNVERSCEFYCKVLGMTVAFREPPHAVFLRCGKDLLTLARTEGRIKAGGMHFGFEMRASGEVDEWIRWLKSNHVRITREREEEAGRGVYFRDPDVYLIEIYYEKN
jgi:catechol 2,3-dioxygenase